MLFQTLNSWIAQQETRKWTRARLVLSPPPQPQPWWTEVRKHKHSGQRSLHGDPSTLAVKSVCGRYEGKKMVCTIGVTRKPGENKEG